MCFTKNRLDIENNVSVAAPLEKRNKDGTTRVNPLEVGLAQRMHSALPSWSEWDQ